MVLKLINATAAKPGSTIMIDGVAYNVKSNDISKTGKHGHTKCRMEMISIIDDKKKVTVIPGDEKLEVPMIEKKKAQVLSVKEDVVSVMDLDSYETFDLEIPEVLLDEVKEGVEILYWLLMGTKVMKQVK